MAIQNIEIRHIKYFLMLAQELNFGRAARRLNITQPPLTRQIKQLEESLGVSLFHRSTRSVALTEAGKAFVPEANAILDRLQLGIAAVRQHSEEPPAEVGIAVDTVINGTLIPRAVKKFRERYGSIELKVRVIDSQEQVAALRDRKVDAGFVVNLEAPSDISVTPVARIPLVAVLRDQHALAARSSLSLADLCGERVVLSPGLTRFSASERVGGASTDAGLPLNIVMEAQDRQLLTGFAAEGLGVAIHPNVVADPCPPGLVRVPLETDVGQINVSVVRRNDDRSRVLSDFVSFVRSCVPPEHQWRETSLEDVLLF